MKKIFFFFLVLPLFSFGASSVNLIKNHQGNWDVYYTAPNNKHFFIFESKSPLNQASISGGDLFYKTEGNIFWIIYTCQKLNSTCIRYVNLNTNQISKTFTNLALNVNNDQTIVGPLYNSKENVVVLFNYPSDWQYTISPIFEDCKHPFTAHLEHLSDGAAPGSRFLSNGDLYLDIILDAGGYLQKVIPMDYPQLFANCQSDS